MASCSYQEGHHHHHSHHHHHAHQEGHDNNKKSAEEDNTKNSELLHNRNIQTVIFKVLQMIQIMVLPWRGDCVFGQKFLKRMLFFNIIIVAELLIHLSGRRSIHPASFISRRLFHNNWKWMIMMILSWYYHALKAGAHLIVSFPHRPRLHRVLVHFSGIHFWRKVISVIFDLL